MRNSLFALPVSVEQIALAIKQMNVEDQQRLLDLVPDLLQAGRPKTPPWTVDEARATVTQVQTSVMQALDGQPPSPNEPFLGDLTLAQYLDLPDEDRTRLWEQWADIAMEELRERDVRPDGRVRGNPAWDAWPYGGMEAA